MVIQLKEFCEDDRPREKFRKFGATALSDKEILAILLRTGIKNQNVIELADSILKDVGGITNLRDVTFDELTKHKGIGTEKAIHILANIEFARRIYATNVLDVKCSSPESIARYLKSSVENLTQEVFIVLDINTKGKIIQQREVFKGSCLHLLFIREKYLKWLLKIVQQVIVCIHNHPSGDATPSVEDIRTTINLMEVGDIIGIEMLDHLIIAKEGYVSIRRFLNYLASENIDYRNEEITSEQLRYILKKV